MNYQIGEYQITECIKKAKTSDIYKGYIAGKKTPFAIRVFSKNIKMKRLQFLKQNVAKTIPLHHPNLILAYGDGEYQDRYYIAMEYFEGITLYEYLCERGALSQTEAIYIILQVANGLAHSKEILEIYHACLSPFNIMIDEQQNIKILKMGFNPPYRDSHKPLVNRPDIIGNPQYLAPEQLLEAKQKTSQIDIFSLGACLYHMLEGTPPFEGWDHEAIIHSIVEKKTPILKQTGISPKIITVLKKMLAKKPQQRYQGLNSLVTDLKQLQRNFPWRAKTYTKPRLVQFQYAVVPREEDIFFAKIANNKKILNHQNLEEMLDQQEYYSMCGCTLSLADIAQDMKLIDAVQRTEIESAKLDFNKQHCMQIFHQVVREYSFATQKIPDTESVVTLFKKLKLDEENWKTIISSVKHLINYDEANALIQLAIKYDILKSADVERCVLSYSNNIIRGKYREIGYIFGNKFYISSRRIALLLRAIRRSRITGRMASDYLQDNLTASVSDVDI